MSSGMLLSAYYVFVGEGQPFESIYGLGMTKVYNFRKCNLVNDELVINEIERYQMYVALDDDDYTFKDDRIYLIADVYEGELKENIAGVKNLSKHILLPEEYTFDQFKNKMKNIQPIKSGKLERWIKMIDEQDRKEIDKRFGRTN